MNRGGVAVDVPVSKTGIPGSIPGRSTKGCFMIEKRCPKCGETKPIGEWGRNSTTKDGLQGWCKSCLRDYSNARYANDQEYAARERERCRDYSNARYANDQEFAERERKRSLKWLSKPTNVEWKRKQKQKWAKDNPEARRESSRRRRAVKNGAEAEKIDLAALFERDGWVCHLCGESVDRNLKYPDPGSASHDHVVPISRGGAHTWDNVKLAHLGCNISKGNKILKGET